MLIPVNPACLKCRDFAGFKYLRLPLRGNKQLLELPQKTLKSDDYMRVENSRDLVDLCFWRAVISSLDGQNILWSHH